MQKALNLMVLASFFITTTLFSARYDPFYINVNCPYGENYCFISNGYGISIFYFDKSLSKQVYKIIDNAISKRKILDINTDNTDKQQIMLCLKPYPLYHTVNYVYSCCQKLGGIISISEENIQFKFATINVGNIKSLFYYKLIVLENNGEKEVYLLPENQRKYLYDLIIASNVKTIRFNVSAMGYKSPYHDKIPAHEIFMKAEDIN